MYLGVHGCLYLYVSVATQKQLNTGTDPKTRLLRSESVCTCFGLDIGIKVCLGVQGYLYLYIANCIDMEVSLGVHSSRSVRGYPCVSVGVGLC